MPCRRLSFVHVAVLFTLAALAAVDARSDPLDPRSPVPPLNYQSSLTTLKPLDEPRLGSWEGANETVNRVGGWRVYAREAQRETQVEPKAAGTQSIVPPQPPATSPVPRESTTRQHSHH